MVGMVVQSEPEFSRRYSHGNRRIGYIYYHTAAASVARIIGGPRASKVGAHQI
jgi:hypothetical protein